MTIGANTDPNIPLDANKNYTSLMHAVVLALSHEAEFIEEGGHLKKWVVLHHAETNNERLIELLMDSEAVRQAFCIRVKDVLVFDTRRFTEFLEQKSYLPDSYTRYPNRIGLTIGGRFLGQRAEVALSWPYKDCVLEGGQTKEEHTRKERFFNEVLAQDEITQLFEPKVLANAWRYDGTGRHALADFHRNPEGTITDNLIVKGNNLVVMHTLKTQFAGKVKMIYIDPPYNTGSDSFRYNDRFSRSTWLTFMRNRLVVARELLSTSGVIFVQCDDNEQAYLKVLMDEVFGEKNFVETYVWKNTDNAPALGTKSRKNVEFIHCYEKWLNSKTRYRGRESDNDDAPLLNSSNSINILEFPAGSIRFGIADGIYEAGEYPKLELLDRLEVVDSRNVTAVRLKGRFKWGQRNVEEELSNGTYFIVKKKEFSIRYQRAQATTLVPDKLIDDTYLSKAIGVETNEDAKKHIDSLNLNFTSYPKPESLVAFFIKAVTDEGDIVLDYHLGSGTTAAAAHKLQRQYIGIEQMDYIQDVAVERLVNVIDGEPGGISKRAGWSMGGSFVYVELMQYNQRFVEQIEASATIDQLMEIWKAMQVTSFMTYMTEPDVVQRELEELRNASVDSCKRYLRSLLDQNQLYVNLSSLQDMDFNISDADKRMTESFYKQNLYKYR